MVERQIGASYRGIIVNYTEMISKTTYIFGAHSRARTLKEYLMTIYPDLSIRAFLVDNDEENPESIDGIPVIRISEGAKPEGYDFGPEDRVYIGTRGVSHPSITKLLASVGFEDIVPVTVELDMKLRNEYLDRYFAKLGRKFEKIDSFMAAGNSNKKMGVYVVSSAFDQDLQQKHELRSFEQVIQVGCALTDKRIEGAVYDDDGDNISGRNAQFCELTALYWVWKNSSEDFVGIEHYRRFFLIDDDVADIMMANDIDVVLPTPLCVMPSLGDNYLFRHENRPYEDMMSVLKTRYPNDYDKAVSFFAQGLYSPCNMLIAKKEVYDRMCEWMFPVLFEVAGMNGSFSDRYQNRYPGFLSERLISFFFELHEDEYKIVYADKNFLN